MKKRAKRVMTSLILPPDLHDWVREYAKANHTTVTRIIVDHLMDLKRKKESNYADQI